jgi:hypothetical protein
VTEPPYRLPAGCTYRDCGTQKTHWLIPAVGRRCTSHTAQVMEQVDPVAAFRIARVWLAWRIDEAFDAAAARWTA